ncbi:MAG: response regulator [Anaerolineales bacterium]|nr:response regulator [Anaerolineales bacterium]
MSIQVGPILVVEDIAAVRELLEVQLRLRGYSVVAVRDGQEALDQLATLRPAVIVTDILMPRVDGFALAHRVRAQAATAGIPIVFLSATYVSAEDEAFAQRLGALRFLPKPVETDELFIAVADALTGQPRAGTALSDREFYTSYRQRLEAKLRQKSAQIARNRQQLDSVLPDQRDTLAHLLAEMEAQHEEIRRELDVLNAALADLE